MRQRPIVTQDTAVLPSSFLSIKETVTSVLPSVRRALMGCVLSPTHQKWDRRRSSQGVREGLGSERGRGGARHRVSAWPLWPIKRCKTISGTDGGAPRQEYIHCMYGLSTNKNMQRFKEAKLICKTRSLPVLSFCRTYDTIGWPQTVK